MFSYLPVEYGFPDLPPKEANFAFVTSNDIAIELNCPCMFSTPFKNLVIFKLTVRFASPWFSYTVAGSGAMKMQETCR